MPGTAVGPGWGDSLHPEGLGWGESLHSGPGVGRFAPLPRWGWIQGPQARGQSPDYLRSRSGACYLSPMEQLIRDAWDWWRVLWPHVLAWSIVGLSAFASAHAILVKRDTRSTIGWVGLIWLSPVFGPLIYFFLGVNRIRSRATHLRSGVARATLETRAAVPELDRIREAIGPDHAPLRSLATLVGRVAGRPLVDGNAIEPLAGGDEAYPAMLAAIDGARQSIGLSTYIFDNDPTGRLFADALGRAVDRGVEVRVLIDGIGSTYSFPPITRLLASRGVRVERFLPASVPIYFAYANLRNHRKIMVVDGAVGFTGGLNIRDGCWLAHSPRHPVRDTHFRIRGPVVTHLLEVFVEDWAFAAEETLGGHAWKPSLHDRPRHPLWPRRSRHRPDQACARRCAHGRPAVGADHDALLSPGRRGLPGPRRGGGPGRAGRHRAP